MLCWETLDPGIHVDITVMHYNCCYRPSPLPKKKIHMMVSNYKRENRTVTNLSNKRKDLWTVSRLFQIQKQQGWGRHSGRTPACYRLGSEYQEWQPYGCSRCLSLLCLISTVEHLISGIEGQPLYVNIKKEITVSLLLKHSTVIRGTNCAA